MGALCDSPALLWVKHPVQLEERIWLKLEMPQHGTSAKAPWFKLFVCKLVQETNTSLLPVLLMMRRNPCETKSTGSLLIFPHQDSDIYSCSNFSECCCFTVSQWQSFGSAILPQCREKDLGYFSSTWAGLTCCFLFLLLWSWGMHWLNPK